MRYAMLAALFGLCVWMMFPSREDRARYSTRDWVGFGALVCALAFVFFVPTVADPDLFRPDPR